MSTNSALHTASVPQIIIESDVTNEENSNGEKVDLKPSNQLPVPNSNAMGQTNQNASAKRPPVQEPAVDRAPRSLFMFTLNSKFRKG